jgi:glutaminase
VNYGAILDEIMIEIQSCTKYGKAADYIPQLSRVDPDSFALYFKDVKGKSLSLGKHNQCFSIQSISKVFTLAIALSRQGTKLWERVGVEPSGSAFNSIVQLEKEKGIPRNPFINSGALVIADILVSELKNPKQQLLDFVRYLAKNPTIDIDIEIYISERVAGALNASLAHMLKSYGNIKNDVNTVLDFYFFQCAMAMSCEDLATAMLAFADHSRIFNYADVILSESRVKRLNAIMLSCGFYDESGEFSFKVGLPGKSGVGGGIIAIHPNQFSIAVWSPRLNKKGNSVMGMKALELFTTKTGLSVF